MTEVDHYGTIVEAGSKSPMKDYTIRFEPEDRGQASPLMAISDEHGTFDVAKIDDAQTWTMVAVDLNGEATGALPVDLELGKSAAKRAVYIGTRISQKVDQRWGIGVLIFLIVFVAGAIFFWVNSGGTSVLDKSRAMLDASARLEGLVRRDSTLITSAAVSTKLDLYAQALPELEAPPDMADKLIVAKAELAAIGLLGKSAKEQISGALEALEKLEDPRLPEDWAEKLKAVKEAGQDAVKLKEAIGKLVLVGKGVPPAAGYFLVLESAKSEVDLKLQPSEYLKKRKTLFLQRLKMVQALTGEVAILEVQESPGSYSQFDWVVASSVTVTVLFWGFVGSAVRLIMVVQGYLRFGRFFVRGVFQHLGLFFAVPLLAAGFVKLASGVSIGSLESGLQLNFADPQVMAVAAFFLALSPWGLWERLLSLSGSIMGRTQG